MRPPWTLTEGQDETEGNSIGSSHFTTETSLKICVLTFLVEMINGPLKTKLENVDKICRRE